MSSAASVLCPYVACAWEWGLVDIVKKRRELQQGKECQEIPFALWKLHEKDSVDSGFGWRFGGFKNSELPDEF